MMNKRKFGSTALIVSALGLGAGHIGGSEKSDKETFNLLDAAYDLGINIIDTARGYGLSEERIGRWIKQENKEIIISTKVGYGVEGVQDWTYDCIIKGVDRARKILSKDVLDIVHLHSCSAQIMQNNGVTEALLKCKDEGKIIAAAYSGENEDLEWAIGSKIFDSFQFSYNLFDQNNIGKLHLLKMQEKGVIIKRPLANAPWRFKERPFGHYCEEYWQRMKAMNLNLSDEELLNTAVRFSAFAAGVDTIIAGTSSVYNLLQIAEAVNEGDIDFVVRSEIESKFSPFKDEWKPQI